MGYYTDERNAQIVIELLKAHNIKKVIASPGTTNACLVATYKAYLISYLFSCVPVLPFAYS